MKAQLKQVDPKVSLWSVFEAMTKQAMLILGAMVFGLASCGTLRNTMSSLKQPLSGDGDYDPLMAPGAQRGGGQLVQTETYRSGEWVRTSVAGASFFRKLPRGNARADQLLRKGTPMRVISTKGSYLKAQLESGDVGYVPGIMVEGRTASSSKRKTTKRRAKKKVPKKIPDYGDVPPIIDPTDPEDVTVPTDSTIPPAPTDLPDAPPAVPDVPSIPDVPTVPEVPEIPEVPETPAPSIPDVPAVPDVPPPPELPGISDPVEIR